MNVIQINRKAVVVDSFALFNLGFRPFFLGASVLAVALIGLWYLVYFLHITLPLESLSSFQWHSHEMIYGYAVAVIAGFLLTAVMNWTGIQTIHGKELIALFLLWLIPRVLFFFGARFLEIAATFDLLFMLALFCAVGLPIVKAKQWKQLGVLSKVILLAIGNVAFYLGVFGYLQNGVYFGIYGGLYLIVSLILIIGSRVLPAFIRNGVGYDVSITNPKWVSILALLLFIPFFLNQLFFQSQALLGSISIALFMVNTYRLALWYTPGIWRHSLLWSVYLALVSIDLGFLLFALSVYFEISPFLAIHAFAFGGIGLATMGMMSRVILGHTGRNVRNPPRLSTAALMVLTLGTITRIGLPLMNPSGYTTWIFLSQLAWVSAFLLFTISNAKMLIAPRIDGQPG